MRSKRATQDDVAQLAGVTRATVSYVLTGRAEELKITPAVIERVKEAARKLRYVPNLAARSLAAGRSRQIGLLLPIPEFVRNQYWGPIASGVERAAMQAGYDVLLLASHTDLYQTAENYLMQNRVDVIIALGEHMSSLLSRLPVPPVVIGHASDPNRVPLVYSIVDQAFKELVDHLEAKGISKITWLGPNTSSHPSSQDRLFALQKECITRHLKLAVVEMRPSSDVFRLRESDAIDHWYHLIQKSPESLSDTEAVVCWNDTIALGLYRWMGENHLVPGRDVAVCGFDDFYAEAALPSLSTISFESKKLGGQAVNLALELLAKDSQREAFSQVAVPAKFIARRSTERSA